MFFYDRFDELFWSLPGVSLGHTELRDEYSTLTCPRRVQPR